MGVRVGRSGKIGTAVRQFVGQMDRPDLSRPRVFSPRVVRTYRGRTAPTNSSTPVLVIGSPFRSVT